MENRMIALRRKYADLNFGFIGMIADKFQGSHIVRSRDMNSSGLLGIC